MLTNGELENLVKGTWQLDCQRIMLRPRSAGGQSVNAAGWIKHDEDGNLTAKLLGAGGWEKLGWFFRETPGRLIHPGELYDLEVLDEFQRSWVSERVHISSLGSSLTASIPWLSSERRTTDQSERLRLVLPEGVKIPCNVRTDRTTVVGGELTGQQSTWNVARFGALDHSFRLTTDASTLQLVVAPNDGTLQPKIELLATDALAFCLARPLEWFVAERFSGGTHRVEIRSRTLEPKNGRRMPPRDLRFEGPNNAAVWSIFERYMAHTSRYVGEGRCPLSAHVLDVLDAAIATVDAHALTLCVTIEGILADEFREAAKINVDVATSFKRAMDALERENLDPQFMRRVAGLLPMLKNPSAKDRLRELVNTGVITEDQMKAWDSLRHRSAHGSYFADVPRQEFVDLLFRVMVLFHHLVFAAIGYRGEYTDYGTYGWPTRSYPP